MNKMASLKYGIFLVVFTLLLAEVALRVLTKKSDHIDYLFGKKSYFLPPLGTPEKMPQVDTASWFKYNIYHKQLGWSIGRLGAMDDLYFSDENGYRCSRQLYDSLIRDSILHQQALEYDIVCLGNSFTHGDEVSFEETWPYQVEHLTGMKTLNLGVGGYGIDQAYLRYQQEAPKSKLVILGMVAGDLDRSRTQIYNLTVGGLKTKPMFVFEHNTIRVENQPALHGEALRQQFENPETSDLLKRERHWPNLFVRYWYDHLYTVRTVRAFPVWSQHRSSIYRTAGEDLDYCISILKEAKRGVEQHDARFVVLLLDNLNTFIDWDEHGNPWEVFTTNLQEAGIEYWYYGDTFYKAYKNNPDDVINRGLVHYTPKANREVAEFVRKHLTD